MRQGLRNFVNDQSGVTAIEYALVAMLIAMAVLASVVLLGGAVKDLWQKVADAVVNAIGV